jgi:hypothetical protein
MGRVCSTNGGKENACSILVRKPEGKRLIGRPRPRRVDNKKIEWVGMDWTDLAQDRDQWRAFVNKVMELRVL